MSAKPQAIPNATENFGYDSFFQDGYLHLNSLLSSALCDQLKHAFENEVKQEKQPLLRQRSVTFETHQYTSQHYMENALLDVHNSKLYPFQYFPKSALKILSDIKFLDIIAYALNDNPVLVQSMFFESSKGTPEHFDKFFLGTEEQLPMLGVWIALEDIHEDSGQFYVYPGSHDYQFKAHENTDSLKVLYERYSHYNAIAVSGHQNTSKQMQLNAVLECKRTLKKLIKSAGWNRYTPAMRKGDILLFSGDILHGSLPPAPIHSSRTSLTAHFIGGKQKNIRYGQIQEKVHSMNIDNLKVHQSKRYLYSDLSFVN